MRSSKLHCLDVNKCTITYTIENIMSIVMKFETLAMIIVFGLKKATHINYKTIKN